MISWLRHQKNAFGAALRRLRAQPVATLFATLAMGVSISLPCGLYLGLGTLGRLAGDLPTRAELSVFVAADASAEQRRTLEARMRQADIAEARYVPKDEALARLGAASGLADVAAGLPDNPLPDAWVVRPRAEAHDALERLAEEVGRLPGVAETHVDSQWAERLQAGLALGRTVVMVLAALLGIALIAISGNVIRAQVLARRDEIQVSRLIGATDRHIRRPFLYLGALQGLLGALAAGGVLAVAAAARRAPVARVDMLYGSHFQLLPPSAFEIGVALGLTALFGWLGAWVSVARTLRLVDAAR
jgi:cell division transport system permease protein